MGVLSGWHGKAWHGALRIGCNCFLYCKIVGGVERVCSLFCLSCMCHVLNEKRMREKEAREQWKGTEKGRFSFSSPLLIALEMLLACVCLLFV